MATMTWGNPYTHDTGYGLCVNCIPLCSRPRSLGYSTMESVYGVRGVHYDVQE